METEIKILPNPTQRYIYISGLPIDTDMTLRDITGEVMMLLPVIKDKETMFDLNHLVTGIYFITFGVGVQGTYKLIKK